MLTRRILAGIAVAGVLFGACSGSSATTAPASAAPPASTAPAASTAASAPAASAAPTTCAAGDINCLLFTSNYKPATGKTGGTIVMGEWQPADQLNPYYTTAFTTFEVLQPAMRGLLTLSSDGKYLPDLAASIPTTQNGGVVMGADGKTFTVTIALKPGLLWSDGQPLTMNDLKYTWQWANDKNQTGCSACSVGFPDIDKIDVSSDGLTATIHFKDLFAGWLGWLTSQILPQHYFSTIAVKDAPKQSMPVSSAIAKVPWSGPFVITNASSTEIDLDRNPNWKGGVSGPHPAYLDHLKMQYFGDKNGEMAAFKNGEIDLALDLTQADYAAIQTVDPSVGSAELTPAWQYEHFDVNNDPTHARKNGLWDPAVRKAIAMAVDKQGIIAAAFPGANLTPACSPAPPGLWYAKTEQCPAYDAAGASAALTAAGWVKDANGIVANNGHEMKLELCTTSGNPTRLTELQKLQGDLKAVGIDSYIKTGDAGSVVFAGWNDTKPTTDCSIYRGNYDIADFAYIITGSPYNDYYYTYSSSQWPDLGQHNGSNDTRYKDATMDAALNKLATDVDLSAQLTDAGAVQDAYVVGIPEIPIYYRAETTGVGVHLGNWPGYAPSSVGPTWDPEDWFYK